MANAPENKAKLLPQYFGALSAAFGSFSFGTVIGWGAPYGGKMYDYKPEELPEYQKTWVVSIVSLGPIIVMLPISFILDRFGRKSVMLSIVVPFTIGWIIICVAATREIGSTSSFVLYCVGRFITGFFSGIFCVAVPVFIGEISQPSIRGTLGVFFELMLVTGIFFVYTLAKFMDIFLLSVICGIIPLCFGAIFLFIPETPYQLLRNKKSEGANKSLQWFRGKDFDITTEMNGIRDFVNESQANAGTLKQNLSTASAKKSMFIGNGLFFFQQLSGICAIIYYSEVIFKDSKSSFDSSDALIILGSVQLVANAAAATFIDKLGRKMLLYISYTAMGVCQIIIGVYFMILESNASDVNAYTWIPLVFLTLYLVSFAFGAGPISWALLGELFPNEIKGMAASICSFECSVLAFVVTAGFPYMAKAIGLGYSFVIFAVICFIGVAFVKMVCIETKGKTLEEIQIYLAGNHTRN